MPNVIWIRINHTKISWSWRDIGAITGTRVNMARLPEAWLNKESKEDNESHTQIDAQAVRYIERVRQSRARGRKVKR